MSLIFWYMNGRQVSSMIHSPRPIVTPVANIVLCCCVSLDLKSVDGRTDNMCKNNDPTGRDCGAAEWINNYDFDLKNG